MSHAAAAVEACMLSIKTLSQQNATNNPNPKLSQPQAPLYDHFDFLVKK